MPLRTVIAHLTGTHITHEIVVVDDGSTDTTASIVAATAADDASIRLVAGPHRGKGGAVKAGVLAARGQFVLFLDADLSTLVAQWDTFAPALASGAISDVTCGFKAFDRAVAQRLVGLQRLDGWAFDAELLFLARRLGYDIRELPVTWRDDPATKVHILRDGVRAFRDLLAIRWNTIRGHYPRG